MSVAAVSKPINRLPDGRVIRALQTPDGKNTFTQTEMFSIVRQLLPAHERILSVAEHDASIQSGAWQSVNVKGWWRTSRYGVYTRGFEAELDKPVGEKVIWIEKLDETAIDYTFDVPDVPHPSEQGKGLRQATGMLEFDISDLIFDESTRTVRVWNGFDPAKDFYRVVDVMRPSEWALVDSDGYPIRSQPSNSRVPEARFMHVRNSDKFERDATGWHGSLVRGVYVICGIVGDRGRDVVAYTDWFTSSGVAVVWPFSLELREGPEGLVLPGVSMADLAALRSGETPEHLKLLPTAKLDALIRLASATG